MNRVTRLALAASLATLAALGLGSCFDFKEMERQGKAIQAIKIEAVDIASVKDGDYEQYENYSLDTAKVRVTVRGGRIEGIKLLEHKHGPGAKHSGAPVMDRVIAKQGLDVDVVSGATGSSKVVLKAIEGALRQGLQAPGP
jgi:uncharacterized protein with FMN-binding domain